MKHIIFTSVNLAYLTRASILASSIKDFNHNVHFVVILSEPNLELGNQDIETLLQLFPSIDEILLLNCLSIELNEAVKSLKVTEVCTSVKPETMLLLLNRESASVVTYIDPDIMVFDNVSRIFDEHQDSDILLTPHLLKEPIREHAVLHHEISGAMKHGVFNLGFISCKKSANSYELLNWWSSRLIKYCREDAQNFVWTDQKWFDLAPVYFNGVKIVKDPGWNMATWNLDERRLSKLNPPQIENGGRLLFYHFSKAPSDGFKRSLASSLYPKNASALASIYEAKLRENHYLDDFLENLGNARNRLQVPHKPTVKLESKLISFALSTPNLIRFIKSSPMLYRIALKFYHNKSAKKIGISAQRNADISRMKFGKVYISHIGGGGVEEFIRKHLQSSPHELKYALLTPISDDKFLIRGFDNHYVSIEIDADDAFSVLLNASDIEVHHLLGWETLVHEFSKLSNYSVYVHDRYLLTQYPFSDAIGNADTENMRTVVRGINVPLNPISKYTEAEWRQVGKKVLENAKNVWVPNSQIRAEIEECSKAINVNVLKWDSSYPSTIDFDQSNSRRKENALHLVVLGAANIHKGITKVIEMSHLLKVHNSDAVITLFGEISPEFLEEVTECDNIIHYGQVERYRVKKFLIDYRHTITGWIPSLTRESYSLAFSDFVDCRVPFFASSIGALAERGTNEALCTLYESNLGVFDLLGLFDRK